MKSSITRKHLNIDGKKTKVSTESIKSNRKKENIIGLKYDIFPDYYLSIGYQIPLPLNLLKLKIKEKVISFNP